MLRDDGGAKGGSGSTTSWVARRSAAGPEFPSSQPPDRTPQTPEPAPLPAELSLPRPGVAPRSRRRIFALLAGEDGREGAGDLRRRLRADHVAKVLDRAGPLPQSDRVLLEAVFRDGRSAVEVGGLLSCPARSVRRRVRKLTARLASPEYVFVVREQGKWSSARRRVADACVIRGLSMQQASKDLGISFHSVRRHMEVVAGLFEGANPGTPWGIPAGSSRSLTSRRAS